MTLRIASSLNRSEQPLRVVGFVDLVDDDLALSCEYGVGDRRAFEPEPDALDRSHPSELRDGCTFDVRRRLVHRYTVQERSEVLELGEHRLAAEHLLEHDVLRQVCDAWMIAVVDRAHAVAHRHLDFGSSLVANEHDSQSIRKRGRRDPDSEIRMARR
jgi:hypothetical protein